MEEMPSKPQPKHHDLPTGRFSWDKEEKPKKEERLYKFNRRCRSCGVFLTTVPEDKLGIHIACVQALNIRQRALAPIMNRPRYGSRNG